MTFLLNGSEGLDRIKCMEMALVHDLAESLVGDITPYCGVSKKDKEILEMEAIHKICGLIEPRGEHILQLFYVSIKTFLFFAFLRLCMEGDLLYVVMQLKSCARAKNTIPTFDLCVYSSRLRRWFGSLNGKLFLCGLYSSLYITY